MEIIEYIFIVAFVIGALSVGYSQWKKTKKLNNAYQGLSKEEKKNRDRLEYERGNALHFSYTKSISKGMWIPIIISVGLFLWVLLTKI